MIPRRSRGAALAFVLQWIAIFILMIAAMLVTMWGQLQQVRQVTDQTAALYLAEAAIMDAVSQLELDPTWTAGFNRKRLNGVDGDYTVKFNKTSGPFQPDESVNNLDGAHPANFRGPAAVGTGMVSLIATARVGMQTRQVEALVRLGGGLYPTDLPLMTTGKITLKGNVEVDGIKSQEDPTAVNAGVHSNLVDPAPGLVSWDGTGMASVTGKVTSSGTAASDASISMGSAAIGQGIAGNAAARSIARIDIVSKIAAKSSSPNPSILPSGTTNVGAGDFYVPGDVVINGDLVLKGSRLHVNGSLTVNGAIRGDGSLYVKGNSKFMGDATVTSGTPDKVALFSHGSVQLQGFEGTKFMDDLATANPTFAAAWTGAKDALRDLQIELKNPTPRLGSQNYADQIRGELSGSAGSYITRPGKQNDNLQRLVNLLNSQPASSARDHMVKKMAQLRSDFFAQIDGSGAEANALANLKQNRIVAGGVDAMIDRADYSAVGIASAYVDGIDYNKLGTSYFQGLVYTHGAFHASNEVNVRGAIVVDGDGSQPDLVVGTETLKPGDLMLGNGTRLTYVEEYFKPANATSGAGNVKVVLWMGR